MSKKILITIPNLGKGGGRQKSAVQIGDNLSDRSHSIYYLTIYDVKPRLDFEGKMFTLDKQKRYYPFEFTIAILQTAKKIKKICKENSIDAVISFGLQTNLSSILSKLMFRNKSKIIVSVRSNMRIQNKKAQRQIKWLYPKADKIVANSRGSEHILRKEFHLKNITTIYNLQTQNIEKMDEEAKKDVRKKHENIFDNDFIFINVGRPSKAKGQWHLIRSFRKVTEEKERAKLIILGGGKSGFTDIEKDLKKLIEELDLKEEVFLLGRVNNVFPYLKNSDCFVFTSLFEGFPNVIPEALSQNLPVISTDCDSGPREILCPEVSMEDELEYPYFGEYGILTNPFEHKMAIKTLDEKPLTDKENMFAQMLKDMIENKELRERYSKGRERLQSKEFDVENLVKEWEEII